MILIFKKIFIEYSQTTKKKLKFNRISEVLLGRIQKNRSKSEVIFRMEEVSEGSYEYIKIPNKQI